ncbi:MAG TPA: hypothetical protein VGF23_09540 [Gaiellaceae bacterium]
MIVAFLRPDSWSLPLFLHVLGATLLFGGTVTLTVLAVAAWRGTQSQLLSRLAFWTFLLVVVPAWILMRAGAQWIADKEFPSGTTPGWVDVGFAVSEPGLLILIPLGILAWLSARRGGRGRLATAVVILSAIYIAALGVAWFAMSAKPGA